MIGVGSQGCHRLSEVLQCSLPVTALCDVDAASLSEAKALMSTARNPLPKTYLDFNELLASDIDAVVIATPDHWHAPIATAALEAGKHVFCEKPLTHTISEARALRQLAVKYPKLSTQLGNQGSASLFMRRGIEIVQAAGIGQVKEVHVWVPPSHSFKPGQAAPVGEDPVPTGLHWDRWIGVAPFHPFKTGAYTPKAWRAWFDFGGGSIADWGCHGLNFPFRSLKLDYPNHIEPNIPGSYTYGYPKNVRLRFDFGRRGNLGPVTVWWYDGGRKPDSSIVPKSVVEHLGRRDSRSVIRVTRVRNTFNSPQSPSSRGSPITLPLRRFPSPCPGSRGMFKNGLMLATEGLRPFLISKRVVISRRSPSPAWLRSVLKKPSSGTARRCVRPSNSSGLTIVRDGSENKSNRSKAERVDSISFFATFAVFRFVKLSTYGDPTTIQFWPLFHAGLGSFLILHGFLLA
jgi:Oxidoreductase family, NAD-binding Rossmann fold/Oxidoreductase family, C-terminal alpha/beta domain